MPLKDRTHLFKHFAYYKRVSEIIFTQWQEMKSTFFWACRTSYLECVHEEAFSGIKMKTGSTHTPGENMWVREKMKPHRVLLLNKEDMKWISVLYWRKNVNNEKDLGHYKITGTFLETKWNGIWKQN